jgi:5-methylcytosine-specific restriction endonuclease McrA
VDNPKELIIGMTRKERQKIHQKKWRDKNIERQRQKCREWYVQNRDRVLEQKKIQFQKLKESGYSDKRRLYQRVNCRYRRIAAKCDNPLTIDQWFEVLEENNYQRKKCGSKQDLTMDHIIPISKGGLHTKSNIGVLCRKCNSSKGAKMESL